MKATAKAILERLGLLGIIRRFRSAEHGHTLLAAELRHARPGEVCVEVGTTRPEHGLSGSTGELSAVCSERGVEFFTIDMNPKNIERVQGQGFHAICGKGEEVLAHFTRQIDYLYLDAFDLEHSGLAHRHRRAYGQYLDTKITKSACHKMHLDCARAVEDKMSVGSIIVFDDVWYDDGWRGKGQTAIPFLLDKGFRVVRETDGAVMLLRIA